MAGYTVTIVSKAEKEFVKLPEKIKHLVGKKILSLEHNPRPVGSKKLKETPYYRLRIGNFRVIYSLNDSTRSVTVLSVADRKEVYRSVVSK